MGSSETTSGGGWKPPSVEHLQELLPQYEISRLLGHGGMGAVYEGLQANLDRKVAIKILPETLTVEAEGLNFNERFKLEAKSMARMNHPGIISVYDFGQTSEGQLYYVMEFIDGMDIHQYLKHHGGKLPAESAIAIVAHVLDALGYAHERGIIHRDIKPANIMIKASGRVKVADFGLVKRLSASGEGSPDSASITVSNIAIGTPDFVAPESLEVGKIVDHRADLYSIGVMFYQLLTGSVPRGNFKPPSGRVPGLDPRLDKIVSRAMEAEPDDRYASADEFRDAIDEILSSPVPEEQYTGPIRPEQTDPVIPGGKRLHLTTMKKKTPAPAGGTGPVKPLGSADSSGVEEPKKKNPALLGALIVVPMLVLGIAGFLLMGGGSEEKERKSKSGQKNRPVEVADRGKGSGNEKKKSNPKPQPSPSNNKPKEKQAASPAKPEPKPAKTEVAAAKKPAPPVEPEPKPKTKPDPPTSKPSPEPTPKPEPASPPVTGELIDLLAQIDLGRDVVKGDWELDGGKLTHPAGDVLPAAIRVAKGPFPTGYDIEFQVERLVNEGGRINLAFSMSGHQGMLVISGEEDEGGWWFEAIDGRGSMEAAEIEAGNVLPIGEPHAVRLEVRKDRIAAFLDGDELLSWKGEPNRLSLIGEWPALMPDANHLYVGAKGAVTIHKLILVPKSADGAAMPAVTQTPVPDPNDPVAARLAEIDAKYREIFEKPFDGAMATLNEQFIGALKREEQAASQTGDLDLVLAFQNEAKRIGNREGAGPATAADAPPRLKEMRKTWHTKASELETLRTTNQKDAHAKRDQALEILVQDLVKAQDIEAAQRVRALRDQLATNSSGKNTLAAETSPDSMPVGEGNPLQPVITELPELVYPPKRPERAGELIRFSLEELGEPEVIATNVVDFRAAEGAYYLTSEGELSTSASSGGGANEFPSVKSSLRDVVSFDVDNQNLAWGGALKEDGSLVFWGTSDNGVPQEPPSPDKPVRVLSLSHASGGVITSEGKCIRWPFHEPTDELPPIFDLQLSGTFEIALTTRGRIKAWFGSKNSMEEKEWQEIERLRDAVAISVVKPGSETSATLILRATGEVLPFGWPRDIFPDGNPLPPDLPRDIEKILVGKVELKNGADLTPAGAILSRSRGWFFFGEGIDSEGLAEKAKGCFQVILDRQHFYGLRDPATAIVP